MKSIILSLLIAITGLQSASQPGTPVGRPDRNSAMDLLPGFINPPKGYGEVSFYWWVGDTLTRERLLWQLDQLQGKGISSLQINYCHTDQGGITYGLSMPSRPALFTDGWWDLMKWFLPEAKKRGMSVSLSDYTLGVGQGFSVDEALREHPELNGSILKTLAQDLTGRGSVKLPQNPLSVTAFQLDDGRPQPATRKDLLAAVQDGTLNYDFGNERRRVLCVYPFKVVPSYNPMHPMSGKAYNEHFFEKFETQFPGEGGQGLNFFFSDELDFHLKGVLWDDRFAAEFEKRKGYDMVPYLDAIFTDIGDITPKIRLDYNDVMVSLSEEYFFKPVYQWHEERGMIYGCDHGGRGKEVTEFGDYFRTQRWNQGPGSDQPRLSKDIIKAKVASSIAHLYQRPRVWLEGFYGSGWGTSTADVTDAIFSNFVAGYNLLSFHGLYYTTHGGWWEWAPPCNHFHMPYWRHIDPLMNCVQRLSYALSQGYHRCDVAVLYPVEPRVADMDGRASVAAAFQTGQALYGKNIDFDFMDYESLARCEVKNRELTVSGEAYKVLVIPSMKAIRYASLVKIEEFRKAGGLIVNVGALPEATEKNGANDKELAGLVGAIFSADGKVKKCAKAEEVPGIIENGYSPHFKVLTPVAETAYQVHRVAGKRDVFALYNFPRGTRCFFKAQGAVELWDPWNGRLTSLANYAKRVADGTELELPLSNKEIQVIVFNPDGPSRKDIAVLPELEVQPAKRLAVEGNWDFELKPSLDNRWGDYEFPAANEFLGAQVRQVYLAENREFKGEKLAFDASRQTVTCAFGPQFLKLGALPEIPSDTDLLKRAPRDAGDEVAIAGKTYRWEEYRFSWQQGVEGDYGHQGYHGLKGEMYDNFIRLGAIGEVKHSKQRVAEPSGNFYILYTTVVAPASGSFDLLTGDVKPQVLYVNGSKIAAPAETVTLNKGSNEVWVVYSRACETYLAFRKPGVPRPEKQPISMSWYGDYAVLPFDCYAAHGTGSGLFAFESAPGLSSFTFAAYGKVSLWVDGATAEPVAGKRQPDGLVPYTVSIKNPKPEGVQVVLKIEYQPGYRGGAALPRYIRQQCGKGTIANGDWSKIQGLKAYSGGAWYRKKITLDAADARNRLELDLGNVISTAEVLVNGRSAGIKLSAPWNFDMTGLAFSGENHIEILVYNTLANHYTTIPTRYPGPTVSGLLGPVHVNVYRK